MAPVLLGFLTLITMVAEPQAGQKDCVPLDGWLNGPAYLAWMAEGKTYSATPAETWADGVSEIAITRTRCLGTCPSYSAILRVDGSVWYEGYCDVARIGQRKGTVEQWRFQKLARLAVEIGFFELKRGYAENVTDQAGVYTSVLRNGQRKTVLDYASSAPARLWALEQMIDETLAQATWPK